nr:hypothetical protein [uncultured bacterium]
MKNLSCVKKVAPDSAYLIDGASIKETRLFNALRFGIELGDY